MQRLLRVYCRGAPSGRIRPENVLFSPKIPPILSKRTVRARFFYKPAFECQNYAGPSCKFRFPRRRFLLAISAAATVPVVSKTLEDEKDEEPDLTLVQSLLDTSEDERQQQSYGVNDDGSIFFGFFRHLRIAFTRYIYEPIATGLRFIQLLIIFVPAFATIPIIFVGSRDPNRDNERTGTLWWYSFLVKQMERAGPTFIKVKCLILY
jgi:hypothetical protein